jgi:hypothetical protein
MWTSVSSCSAVSSAPGMNSICTAAQAAAAARNLRPCHDPSARWRQTELVLRAPTSSSGVNVPSENCVCRCRSANFISLVRAGRKISPRILSRMPFTNLPLSWWKIFGDVHRLVDADHRRDIVAMEHFVNGQAHDIAIHGRDAVEVPVLGVLLDVFVNRVAVLQHALMSGSANRRNSASSVVGGGSSVTSPHLAWPFSSSIAAARWEFQNAPAPARDFPADSGRAETEIALRVPALRVVCP